MKKKLISMVLAVVLLTATITGCGNGSGDTKAPADTTKSAQSGTTNKDTSGENKAQDAEGSGIPDLDTSKQVEIVMYSLGTEPAGQQPIWDKLNELLLEKLNCTLKVNYISFADYPNKYPLLFSSGEAFDMAYAASWLNYPSLAQKGAFMELDEMWPKYAPNNYAQASETAKNQSKVDGHSYCVPSLNRVYSSYGPIYRMDLVKDLGFDKEIENFADLEEYMDLIKANYPEMQPLSIYSMGSEVDDTYMYFNGMYPLKGSQNDFLWIDPAQENPQIFTYYDYEKTPEFLEMMSRWNEKGFYPKSALADTDSKKFNSGIAAVGIHSDDAYVSSVVNNIANHPDWDVRYSNFTKDIYNLSFKKDDMVIYNTSKNQDRALDVWDLLTTDEEIFDLFYYGIEGLSYELNDKDEVTILDTDNYGITTMWAVKNSELMKNSVGTPDKHGALKAEWDAYIKDGQGSQKYRSFVMDTSPVETEYSACLNAHQQYWWPLELGYTDPVKGLEEYKTMMEAAGIEKVIAELQRQLDEYVASQQ